MNDRIPDPALDGKLSVTTATSSETTQGATEDLGLGRLAQPLSQPPSKKRWFSVSRWFNDLPIAHKQGVALIACELVPIVGMLAGSGAFLEDSLYALLFQQVKSELALTKVRYTLKVDQMGFGSRGQSDNATIISAAKSTAEGNSLSNDVQESVRRLLQNETKARKIEFATLVGKDRKIIANANVNRQGQIFDPNNLVSEVFKNPRQIKVNTLVTQAELTQEGEVLPKGYDPQTKTALIRYVITPVRDLGTQQVVGALVFGDLVNSKLEIVQGTLDALEGGYSSIYYRQPSGEFALATGLEQLPADNVAPKLNVALPNPALLTQATASEQGKPVTQVLTIGSESYALAAQALPEKIVETPDGPRPVFSATPTAILVRGVSEQGLNGMLGQLLQREVLILVVSIAVIALWSLILRRTILRSIINLEKVTQRFSQGNRAVRGQVTSQDEVGQLTHTFNRLADSIVLAENELSSTSEQAKLAREITLRMRQSFKREDILNTAVGELRRALNTDRVIVYQFNPDWNGTIVAESMKGNWKSTLHQTVQSPFLPNWVERYRNGHIRVITDINAETLTDSHAEILTNVQVRASIVAPIIQGTNLVGLLVAHECAGPRHWQAGEVALLQHLSTQVGFLLDLSEVFDQGAEAQAQAKLLVEEQRSQKETLQKQLLELLHNVEDAAQGNLTVRADVTAGEIGIVADFFNSIIESLRQIVTKVKSSAVQVNTLLGTNEQAMQELADQALRQAEETTRIIDSVETMTQSIKEVADNARQAATVAKTATQVATSSEVAMDLTVQSILNLRGTIDDATHQVQQLGDATQHISRIVSIIDEIAVQTDMLAINAGMEASRSGENGRGFAILASEVGQLAARSATATREIEQIVDVIQRETKAVVAAMNQGTIHVVEGADQVKVAKQNLVQIVQVSRQIDELVEAISHATVSQTVTSQSVSALIKEIAQVSEQTSTSSRQVSGALRQTVEVAQKLKESVETFDVGQVRDLP
jgi:twitching motility protein PilJ